MNTIALLLIASTIPLRNPFWPIGYEGTREAILDEPKIQLKNTAESNTDEDTKTSVTAEAIAAAAEAAADESCDLDRRWVAARKALRFGGTMKTSDGRQSITINGNLYRDGDIVGFTFGDETFFWRVKELADNGTLKLVRLGIKDNFKEKGNVQ